MKFASRTKRIRISGIRRIFEAAGQDDINLGLGQPDFPSPEMAKQAAIEAINDGKADGYTSNQGIKELRDAVSEDICFEASSDEVLITSGASEALHIAVEAHVDPGDEVLIPDPGFVSYDALAKVADAKPKPVKLDEDLRLDPTSIKEAISGDTVAIFVNSPANPTGSVQSKKEIKALAEMADDYDITLISDEVYSSLVYDGSHYSPAEFGDNIVVVNGASKRFSMTGWRLGYVVASKDRIDEMIKVHQYIQACASAPAQYGVLEALTNRETQEITENMNEEFRKRRDLVLERLEKIGLETPVPRGAFYVFPKVPRGFVEECLDKGVITVPGEAFGDNGEGYARISYANSRENIKKAFNIIEKAVTHLR